MTPAYYCRDKTRKAKSSFSFPFFFLSPERRAAMYALYAFCREVDDIVDNNRPQAESRQQLNNWRQELHNSFSGKPSHPVGRELATYQPQFNLPKQAFFEILDGMEMDLNQNRYQTLEELTLYCQKVAVAVGVVAINIFSHNHPQGSLEKSDTQAFAYHLGIALQLTNILRDIPEDAQMGRIYLPQHLLITKGVSEHGILNNHWSPQLGQALQQLGQVAKEHYQQAEAIANTQKKRSLLLPALLMSSIYHAYLKQLEKQNFNCMDYPIKLSTTSKLWIIWRTWRNEKNRTFST